MSKKNSYYIRPEALAKNQGDDALLINKYLAYKNASKSLKEPIKEEIEEEFFKHGYEVSENEYNPLTKEEKKLIRIDFYGAVEKPRSGMSKAYLHNMQNKDDTYYEKSEYDNLKDWPIWQIAKQSKRFASIETKLINYLQKNSINPKSLYSYNLYDFQDILYESFKDNDGDRTSFLFEGQKSRFVRTVVSRHQKKIKEMFIKKGVVERKIDEVTDKMIEFGITDLYSVNKHGQVFEDTDIKLEVHHKKPLASMGKKEKNIFKVNDFDNLCIVINNHDFPLHKIIHMYDIKEKFDNNEEQIISKMLMPKDMVFTLGLEEDYCIHDEKISECENKNQYKHAKNKGGR